jgi:serine/threonine protein kinase
MSAQAIVRLYPAPRSMLLNRRLYRRCILKSGRLLHKQYDSNLLLLTLLLLPLLAGVIFAERAYPQGCAHRDPTYYDYDAMEFPPPASKSKSILPTAITYNTDDYMLTRRLGTGKFSDVFEAVDVHRLLPAERQLLTKMIRTGSSSLSSSSSSPSPPTIAKVDPRTVVVIKCLKPVSERKIRREILVLQRCNQLPNLARLDAVILPNDTGATSATTTKMPSLVLQHAGMDSQWLCHGERDGDYLTDYEIRYYLFHLLIALDGLHSIGIFHRDVKPRNALINRNQTGGPPRRYQQPLMLIDLGLADF